VPWNFNSDKNADLGLFLTYQLTMEEHHDVYDATSRSVQLLSIPQSLREEEIAPNILREDLPVEGARVFVLRNFFTPEECNFFIDATEGN
jgi:hypothetical protein